MIQTDENRLFEIMPVSEDKSNFRVEHGMIVADNPEGFANKITHLHAPFVVEKIIFDFFDGSQRFLLVKRLEE